MKATKHNVVDIESAAPVIDGCERMGIERDHRYEKSVVRDRKLSIDFSPPVLCVSLKTKMRQAMM